MLVPTRVQNDVDEARILSLTKASRHHQMQAALARSNSPTRQIVFTVRCDRTNIENTIVIYVIVLINGDVGQHADGRQHCCF